MRIRLDLDQEATERLVEAAVSEQRPVHWQAEVILRRALGLPFPHDPEGAGSSRAQAHDPLVPA